MPIKKLVRALSPAVPWWTKLGAKLVLARLPIPHAFWKGRGIFEHGRSDQLTYARAVWKKHSDAMAHFRGASAASVLELGPGEGGFTFGLALGAGYERATLVDVGPFFDPEAFLRPDVLVSCGTAVPSAEARARVRYLTAGLSSVRQIEADSIDLVFSHAVLQHVRRSDVLPLARELFRITTPGGIGSHTIDFRDHLGGGLHHLRLPSHLWETAWFANSGFYTNRLRYSEVLQVFRSTGFEIVVTDVERFGTLPVESARRSREFSGIAIDDLSVAGCTLVVRRPSDG